MNGLTGYSEYMEMNIAQAGMLILVGSGFPILVAYLLMRQSKKTMEKIV